MPAVDLSQLLAAAIQFLPRLISALMLFAAGILLSRLAERWLLHWSARRIPQVETQQLITRLARWAVLILFSIAALGQVNFDVTAFLAGLGVAGLTIGFALQDLARNFVAGIIVLVRRPFGIGDAVKIGEHTGQVLAVSTRDTTLATWDGQQVIIPNLQVLEGPISNYSLAPHLRRTVMIRLGYGQDIELARAAFLAAATSVDGVLAAPAPIIHAEELGPYAVSLALRYWVDHHTSNMLDIGSDVIVALTRAAEVNGLVLPYPIQDLRLTGVS